MPYGNINNAKRFSYNKRFSYVGNAYDALNAVNIFSNEKLTEYSKTRNLWIQIIRDSDSATLDVTYDAANKAAALTWSAGTNSYICKRYSQVSGASDITISSSSDQELIITGDAWVNNTAKYCLFEPSKSTLSVMDTPLSVNGRMKNKALAAYIIQKDDKSVVTGYTSDYVFPVKCSAGLMDFGWTNLADIYWYLAGGSSSTNARPAATLSAGVSYSFGTNMQANNIEINANSTGAQYIGNTIDLPKITNYIRFFGCVNAVGDINNLPRTLSYCELADCGKFTGDIANLPRTTNQLSIRSNNYITGNLSNVISPTSFFRVNSCGGVSGIFIPSTSINTLYLYGTAMSAGDTDQTLINLAAITTVVSGGILYIRNNRTAASDAAVASLAGKFTITYV
jgi:hypothetical protein